MRPFQSCFLSIVHWSHEGVPQGGAVLGGHPWRCLFQGFKGGLQARAPLHVKMAPPYLGERVESEGPRE